MIRRLLAASLAAALIAAPLAAPAAVVTVTSAAALQSAVNAAHAGDVVQCVGGPFNGLAFTGLSFTSDVTIQSAASATTAYTCTLGDFTVTNATHLAFKTLDMLGAWPSNNNNGAYQVKTSHFITFANDHIHGTIGPLPAAAQTGPGTGLAINGSDHITLKHNAFSYLVNGLVLANSTYIQAEANDFNAIGSDGTDLYEVGWLNFVGNTCRTFYPPTGAHPDCVQAFTTGATSSDHDLNFTSNVVAIDGGGLRQGIFLTDQTSGVRAFQNVNISGNLFCGTNSNAIDVSYGVNVTIAGNVLYPIPGTPVWVRYDHLTGMVAIGGNTVGAAQTDQCAAKVTAWPAYGQ